MSTSGRRGNPMSHNEEIERRAYENHLQQPEPGPTRWLLQPVTHHVRGISTATGKTSNSCARE